MFGCTKCGACCRHIREAVENVGLLTAIFGIDKSILDFPYKWNDKGECEKLKENACSVYNERPLMCNIDKIKELSGIEESVFYDITKQSCNALMKAEGIYEQYKIK